MSTTINTSSAGLIESTDNSGILQLQTANTAALTITTTQDVLCNSTGAVLLTSGTTAQRPASPVNGMMRYNTTLGQIEGYANSVWNLITSISLPAYTASYLVVGGGGGGGSFGGGGGAGGLLTGNTSIYQGTVYPVTVGAGGTGYGASDIGINGNNGGSSSVFQFTAYGGGGASGGRWTLAGACNSYTLTLPSATCGSPSRVLVSSLSSTGWLSVCQSSVLIVASRAV